MPKIKQAIDKFIRKGFWLSKQNGKNIEEEAKKKNISESALMRCIINNWFEK